MSLGTKTTGAPTSPAHDAFQMMFETTDMVSLYWQPFVKGVGRWQLELAQAGAKQSRAAIEFGQRMTRVTNPIDVVNAQVLYWQQIGEVYSDANQHITQALVRAAEPPAGIEILPVQNKRPHDTLRLEDLTPPRSHEDQRKVA
jgi:hypothetical protein